MSGDEEQIDWFDLGSADESGSDKPPRQPWPRWFTLAVIAAVVIAFGLAVLRHQHGARSAASVTSPSTSPTSSSPTTPTPTPTPTATTTPPLPPSEVSVTRVGHRLLGTTAGWQLIGRGDGVLVRVELAAGRITRTTIPNLQNSSPVSVLTGSDRVVIRTLDDQPSYLVPDGKPARRLSASSIQDGPYYPGPGPNQVWRVRSDGNGEKMGLATLGGGPLAGSLQVPPESSSFDAVPDGAGYLLFNGVGGLYDARPGGLHRITTGTLLAVGPTGWLVLECDDQHRCHPVYVRRLDGSRRVVHATISQVGSGAISPDGTMAALFASGPEGGGLYLLDLASGIRRDLGILASSPDGSGGFVFSPDGRWLFVITIGGTLAVVNCRTGVETPLGADLPPLNQLVIRPAR